MPDQRDPRVDPRPGDELGPDGVKATVIVTRLEEDVVRCVPTSVEPGCHTTIEATLDEWRELMANARVIARGGEQ